MSDRNAATEDSGIPEHTARENRLAPLVVGAIGVVYGDIGTSPLYAIQTCFSEATGIAPTQANVYGILSLIFWSLTFVVAIKYVVYVMRADNRGEGGILALMALALRTLSDQPRQRAIMMAFGLFGAALFYGDGMITPAISVLSAIEGLEVVMPHFSHYIVPMTVAVMIVLFSIQRKGTAKVGAFFGPVMLVWFVCIGALGVVEIAGEPLILGAIFPHHAVRFFIENKIVGFLALGSVVLAVTGAEALYADMGHFGKKPIRIAWFMLVMPALLLNYFGQGAFIMNNPDGVKNPFYLIVPEWGRLPMILLATMATVIASQAVISGAFSLARQAVQLGYSPRIKVLHTSEDEIGQIYVPQINWFLFVCVIALVVGFRSSASLASAYGIAVTGTMTITTLMSYFVARGVWGWSRPAALFTAGLLLSVDLAFLLANAIKIEEGGWFPIVIGAGVYLLMSTWHKGRQIFIARIQADALSLDAFIARMKINPPMRVPGTAVFLTSNPDGVPYALLHNMKHNKVLHKRVVFLNVKNLDVPRVGVADRFRIETLDADIYRMSLRYGFKDEPDIPQALRDAAQVGMNFNMMETSFFLGRETIIPTHRPDMAFWREKLYVNMAHNAASVTEFFRIPSNRVVELGTQIEL